MLHCFIICLGQHCPLHPVVCRTAANFLHLCLSVASLVTDPQVFCMALSLLSIALLHDGLGLPTFSCLFRSSAELFFFCYIFWPKIFKVLCAGMWCEMITVWRSLSLQFTNILVHTGV